MGGYWIRHRLLMSIAICCVVTLVSVLIFVFPYVLASSETYNSQSLYKNSDIDFVVPEPSFDQVAQLSGSFGINKIFPFYKTTSLVSINNKTRSTNVLMTDQMQNVDITMYNIKRLIKESNNQVSNPIMIDWEFSHDTGANIGDVISLSIGENNVDYTVVAIYESNNLYDGGAILVPISTEQKDYINKKSKNNGYSAMYVSASDYGACQSYLKSEYIPMGRLKDRSLFDSDDQYQIHYDAIMSSGYANEITDFRVKEDSLSISNSAVLVCIASGLVFICMFIFNVMMRNRGSEKNYFKNICIPKGLDVRSYYKISFIFELVFSLISYAAVLFFKVLTSAVYIPNKSVLNIWIFSVPVILLIVSVINLISNNMMVSGLIREYKKKKEKEREKEKEAAHLG